MSAGGQSLGRVVLELVTDGTKLRQGLNEARTDTGRAAAQMKEAARLQFQVDLARLKTDLGGAEREMATARRLLEQNSRFELGLNLAQFKNDLKTAQREQAAALKEMQRQAREASRSLQPQQAAPASEPGSGFGFLGGVAAGAGFAAINAGFGLIVRAASAAKDATFDYNATLEDATDTILGFQHSAKGLAEQLAVVDGDQGKAIFGTRALTEAVAALQPAAKRSGESMQELLKLAETLASLNPQEGLSGAAYALGELAGGDVQSVADRFNVSRQALQDLREQGVGDIQALQQVLQQMGVDFQLVSARADNFSTRLRAALEGGAQAAGTAFRPAFEGVSNLLGEIVDYLNSPQVKSAGAAFASGLAADIQSLRDYLSRDDVRQALGDLAHGMKEAGAGAVDLAKNLATIVSPAAGAARALGALDSQTAQSAIVYAATAAGLVKIYQGMSAIQAQGGIAAAFTGMNAAIAAPLLAAGASLIAINETAKTLTGSTMPDLIASVIRYGDVWARAHTEADAALNAAKASGDPKAQRDQLQAEVDKWRQIKDGVDAMQVGNIPGTHLASPGDAILLSAAQAEAAYNLGNATKALEVFNIQYEAYLALRDRDFHAAYTGTGGGERDRRITTADISGGPPPTAPLTIAIAPDTETGFQAIANQDMEDQGRVWAAQLQQARQDLRAFADDWASEDFDLFDKLAPQVKAAFDQAFGGLDIQQQFERGLGSLDAVTGRIVEDIQNTGKVSQETADLIRKTLGTDAGDAVLALANQYAAAAAAADKLKAATSELESAQQALSAAQKVASQHADEARQRTDDLQRSLSDLSHEADEVARGYAERLDAINKERQAAQDLAEQHRKEYQAQIDGLASVQAAKAKSEAVENLTADQDKTLLSFEQRIRAARRPGGAGEAAARALEEERDRFLARSRYAIDLASLEARVAQEQADKDSKAIQDKADAQAKVDQAALDDIDARAKKLQDEAKQVADDYAARQRAIQAQIDKENERARIIAAADKKAIDDAQTRVDNATTARNAAQDEATAAANKATAMQNQSTELNNQIKAQKDFITYLQSLGIDVAKYFNGTGTTGVGVPPPGNGSGGGTRGPGTPEALRVAPDSSYFRVPSYTPPVPPSAAPGWAMAGGGGGASYLRSGGGDTHLHGPFATFPNATIRETVDIERAIEGGALRALQALRAAEDEDGRAGGNVSWGRG